MLPSDELEQIVTKSYNNIDKLVVDLFRDFIKQSPVDTSNFRSSWDLETTGPQEWRLTNDAEYATILFDGRRLVAGKWQGSEQWPEGGLPMLARFEKLVEKELNGSL